jgi:hypothetical protein
LSIAILRTAGVANCLLILNSGRAGFAGSIISSESLINSAFFSSKQKKLDWKIIVIFLLFDCYLPFISLTSDSMSTNALPTKAVSSTS